MPRATIFWVRHMRTLANWPRLLRCLSAREKLDPHNYDVRYDLGMVLAKLGRTGQAIEQFEAAKTINPNGAEAHYELAMVLRKQGETARSKEEMDAFQKLKAGEDEKGTPEISIIKVTG